MRGFRIGLFLIFSIGLFSSETYSISKAIAQSYPQSDSLKTPVTETAAAENAASRITVIAIDGLSFTEWVSDLPSFRKLREGAAVGAMNVRTGKGQNDPPTTYLSMALGQRVDSAPLWGGGFERKETIEGTEASSWASMWSGEAFSHKAVIVPAYFRWLTDQGNEATASLGQLLLIHGYAASVYGNADEGEKRQRYAAFLTMDGTGATDYGSIASDSLMPDATRTFGVRTNYAYLLEKWKEDRSNSKLSVIELGDLSRLFAKKKWFTDPQFSAQKETLLREIDQFIGNVMSNLAAGERLIVLSPSVNSDAVQSNHLLTPIALFGKGIEAGMLTSSTTERRGVVTLLDVAPSILSWLGISPPDTMGGQQLEVIPSRAADLFLNREVERITTVYTQRPSILYSYITYQVAVLLVGLMLLLKKLTAYYPWLKAPLLSLLVAPLSFLWMSVYESIGMAGYLIAFMTITSVCAYLLSRLSFRAACGIASAANLLFLIGDGLMGGPLGKYSVLGYDPIIGARFYGMGNEYMGVVIGSAILLNAVWLEGREKRAWQRVSLLLAFAAIVVFFAVPFWGTNAGGALAATIAFGFTWLRFFPGGGGSTWKKAFFYVTLPLIGLSMLFLFNFVLHSNAVSHIGRAFQALAAGDVEEIRGIVWRKFEMNWKLIQHSSWSKLFITALFAMVVLIWRPIGRIRQWNVCYPSYTAGFAGIIIGAIAALLLNDSGIVAAATAIVYAVVPIMLLPIEEEKIAEQRKAAQLSASSSSHSS